MYIPVAPAGRSIDSGRLRDMILNGGSEPSIAFGCPGLASQYTPPDGTKTVCWGSEDA